MKLPPLPSFLRRKPDYNALLASALFVDTETAGLDPVMNGVVSVGACTIGGAEWYGECRMYSHQIIQPAALKVNGFSKDDIAYNPADDKPSAHEMVRQLVEWARKTLTPTLISTDGSAPIGYMVGQNARFDYEMLKSPWDNVLKEGPRGAPFPFAHRTIDLHALTCAAFIRERRAIPAGGIFSGDTQAYLGMPEEPKPHNALAGAKYHRDMLLALLSKLS